MQAPNAFPKYFLSHSFHPSSRLLLRPTLQDSMPSPVKQARGYFRLAAAAASGLAAWGVWKAYDDMAPKQVKKMGFTTIHHTIQLSFFSFLLF